MRGKGCSGTDTHFRSVEAWAHHGVHYEGEGGGEGGDDAHDADVNILDITDKLHLFLLTFPQGCERQDHMFIQIITYWTYSLLPVYSVEGLWSIYY